MSHQTSRRRPGWSSSPGRSTDADRRIELCPTRRGTAPVVRRACSPSLLRHVCRNCGPSGPGFSSVGISASRSWPSTGRRSETELLEDRAGTTMPLACPRKRRASSNSDGASEHRLGGRRGGVEASGHQPRQVVVERAHRRRDRHVVVVQDDQIMSACDNAGVVQRLERHAGAHRAVPDDRDHRRFRPGCLAATAMPSAAEIEVDEWAVPKVSYSLSSRRGKPPMPRAGAACASGRAGRSGSCADSSGAPRPRSGDRAACRTRRAARPSARRRRGWTTGGRRSATRAAAGSRAVRARPCAKLLARQAP